MYWLFNNDPTDPYAEGAGKLNVFSYSEKVTAAMKESLDPKRIQNFFLTLENDAKKLNTQIGNGLTANATNIQNIMQNVYKEGLKYGFAFGDAKDYMEAIQTSSQRMMSFTTKNVENAVMLSKALGVGAKEVGTMYTNFIQAGMSQETANVQLTKIMMTARKYGVDAATLTKTVSDNVYKAQLYGFKDGVKGLTDMAIQAQRVGTNMDLASKAAEKAFNPENAIEMASTMQMLGGSVGALADPFQLMNMAQSDMGALQDQILKSSASMVDFNNKTGEFKISPEMRRNMTQFAESIGSNYEEVAKSAIKFRKEQEVMSRIPLTAGMSDADKSVIASMAEIGPGGTIQIKDPNTDKMVDLTKLSDNQIQQLIQEQQELTKDMSKDPKEIALKQLSVSETMSKTLEQIQQQNIFKFDESQRKTLLETNKGLTMYGKDPTTGKQHDASGNFIFAKEYKELFDKMTQEGKTVIDLSLDAYEKIVEIDKKYIETITNGYTTMVNGLSTLLTKLVNVVSTGTTSVPTIQTNDFFLPSDSKTMITSDFGGMTKKIIPNNDDTLLGMPKESMESLFKYANFGGEVSTMVPKEKNFDKNVQTLTQYVEQKIVTENTSNVKLGVDPINVNVKLEGTGLSKDEISKLINQNDINDAVVEKLRDLMDPTKLMNSIPKLKI